MFRVVFENCKEYKITKTYVYYLLNLEEGFCFWKTTVFCLVNKPTSQSFVSFRMTKASFAKYEIFRTKFSRILYEINSSVIPTPNLTAPNLMSWRKPQIQKKASAF